MRIGIDYRPALLSSSGIARAVRELCRGLAQLADSDLDLRLFGHSLARARRQDAAHMNGTSRLHRWPIPGRSLGLLARLGLDARRLAGNSQLFHLTDYIHPPIRTGKVVLTLHDVAFDPAFHGEQGEVLRKRSLAAAQRADRIITPSKATQDAAVANLEVPAERFTVIPFGADHGQAPANQHAPFGGKPFIVSVGTVEPRKNHQRLLAAWRQLPEPRPRLVICGRPGWANQGTIDSLRRAVREEDVIWEQTCDDAQVHRYLKHARLLAYPSLLEGFGFPPLEAMRLGTPVLAGDNPALREVLANGALFCDPRDVEHIADGMRRLIDDGTQRQQLTQTGARVAKTYTWRGCAERHLAAYREVLTG